jgi:demethylmenaquinone methyltransferase/2-methoxy-6-polyprenyl-1,4-benzoquinol methylase
MSDKSEDKTTHFGFRDVPEAEKAGMVHGVFSRVASQVRRHERPDVGRHPPALEGRDDGLAGAAARASAAGRGGRHRRRGLPLPEARPGRLGGGLRHDRAMLVEGRKRAEAENLAESLDWVVGDAMALPFPSNSFDVYTISFGIRNVTRIPMRWPRPTACCDPAGG